MTTATRDTIVVGTSAGGGSALVALVRELPADLPASLLVVAHQHPESAGYLAAILQARTRLEVLQVQRHTDIVLGRIYLAPPDRHMVVVDGGVTVTMGPMENRTRPAINPLFRTAAAARTGRTIGVLLTGLLDDGAAGLQAIKRCGGLAVVQDPADAEFPDMPRNAIAAVEVDHVVPISGMAELLVALAAQPAPRVDVPDDIRVEAQMSGPAGSSIASVESVGDAMPVSCPSCGGPLWQVHNGAKLYRCSIGHAFSPGALLVEQSEEIERGLWVAVRTLEERARLLDTLARDSAARGSTEPGFERRAAEARQHAAQLRGLLTKLHPPAEAAPRDDLAKP